MSLSALALYVLARELPRTHTKAMASFVPVLVAGSLVRLTVRDPTASTVGLAVSMLAAICVLLVVFDGLRRRLSFSPSSHDTSS
jgi:hypothetical protein